MNARARSLVAALCACVLLSGGAIGCGETTLARSGARQDSTWQIRGDGWSFTLPSSWEPLPVSAPMVARARSRDGQAAFLRNANLVVEPFEGDARAYARQSLDDMVQVAALVAERESVAGGQPAVDVEVRWASEPPAFRTFQRYVAFGGSAFVVTCALDESEIEQHRSDCERVLDSLRVAAPEAGR